MTPGLGLAILTLDSKAGMTRQTKKRRNRVRMDDNFEEVRDRLVQDVQDAAKRLLAYTSTETMIFALDEDSPPRYIVIGDNLSLKRLCGIINLPCTSCN